MTAQSAPGPWDWEATGVANANGGFHCYIVDANGRKIAAVWGKGSEKEATAMLLSAAYRMAFAIREAAKETSVSIDGTATMPRALYDELENALDAATGEYSVVETKAAGAA